MGFLSKLAKKVKKSPIAQMFLPMALSAAFPAIAGSTGLGTLFGKMNPMMANALKQGLMGYGTAAMSGSKRPGKAAMYAGLTSLPFSYMSASQAANRFNLQHGDVVGQQRELLSKGVPGYTTGGPQPFQRYVSPVKPTYGLKDITGVGGRVPKMSAWDVLSGEKAYAKKYGLDPETFKGIKTPDTYVGTDPYDPEGFITTSPDAPGNIYKKLVKGKSVDLPTADIFSKTTPEKLVQMKDGSIVATGGEQVANWLPTAASQAAAMYGGSDTDEEKWEAAQKKRKKELAWMYGVPEDMIEGEMTNPWATGGGFWNKGGIASLENGGDVSGPGSGTSDSINANLSDGEFVMTAKAVENLGGGDRYAGARQMYDLMNVLDPESETMSEVV